jgi:hypothetical protein
MFFILFKFFCVFLFFRFLIYQAQNPVQGIVSAYARPFPSHRSSCRPRVCSFFYLPRLEEQIKSFVLRFSTVFLRLCFPFIFYCFPHSFFHVLFLKFFFLQAGSRWSYRVIGYTSCCSVHMYLLCMYYYFQSK